jgi:hypothetical protein
MGLRFFDQYSLLHFSVGVLAYFWSISFFITIMIHILFEFIENTPVGMNFINNYFLKWWPGGKTHPDNLLNRTSDTIFTGMGWIMAQQLDKAYKA